MTLRQSIYDKHNHSTSNNMCYKKGAYQSFFRVNLAVKNDATLK